MVRDIGRVTHWSCAYVYVLIAYVTLIFMMLYKRNHTSVSLTHKVIHVYDCLHSSLGSVFVVK